MNHFSNLCTQIINTITLKTALVEIIFMSLNHRRPQFDFFNELPLDVEHHISSFTDPKSNASLNLTCKRLAVYVSGDAMGHFIFDLKESVDGYRTSVCDPNFDVDSWKRNVSRKLQGVKEYFAIQKQARSIKAHVMVIDRALSLISWLIYVARVYVVNQWNEQAQEQVREIENYLVLLSLEGVPYQNSAWPSVNPKRVSEKREDMLRRVRKIVESMSQRGIRYGGAELYSHVQL